MQDSTRESHMLERNGCPIHYWVAGDPRQPLVTFIHGAAADHHIFDPQIDEVARFFRVLLWDMRSHGRSQPAGTLFSLRTASEDLIALLDHLGYTQSALVGLSLGGNIAQEVAFLYPERVTLLAIVGTACNTLSIPPIARFMLWLFMLIMRHAPINKMRRFLIFFAAQNHKAKSQVYHEFLQVSEQDHRQIMEAFNEVFHLPSAPPGYRITNPLLILHGQYDNFWNQWLIPHWAKREPNCRYILIPSAGHLANWDNTSQFNRILIDFLREQMLP